MSGLIKSAALSRKRMCFVALLPPAAIGTESKAGTPNPRPFYRNLLTLQSITLRTTIPSLQSLDEWKENLSPSPPSAQKRKRQLPATMAEIFGDPEVTPRPNKKRNLHGELVLSATPSSEPSSVGSELESHKSGRMSPSKQMAVLEDLMHPALFYDFGTIEAIIPADVEEIRAHIQSLADGVGILGYDVTLPHDASGS